MPSFLVTEMETCTDLSEWLEYFSCTYFIWICMPLWY